MYTGMFPICEEILFVMNLSNMILYFCYNIFHFALVFVYSFVEAN